MSRASARIRASDNVEVIRTQTRAEARDYISLNRVSLASVFPEQFSDPASDVAYFLRYADAVKYSEALIRQSPTCGETNRRAARQGPLEVRSDVLRCPPDCELVPCSQAAI